MTDPARSAALAESPEHHDPRSAELDTQRQALEEDRRQCEARQAETQQGLSAQAEELNTRLAELDAQRHALEEDRRQWEARQAETQQGLSAQAEELSTRLAELDAQRHALEEDRRQWEAQRAEAEKRLQRAEQLDANLAELEAARRALQEERHRWLAEQAVGESAFPRSSGDSQKLPQRQHSKPSRRDFSEVDRRIGPTGVLPDTGPQHQPPDQSQPKQSPVAPQASATPKTADEEESIEQYMARLLQRVGASSSKSSPTQEQPQTTGCESRLGLQASDPAESQQPGPEQLAPRAVAPENVVDLSTMRELANLSAHTAIDHHARAKMLRVIRTKLGITVLGLIVGVGLLAVWRAGAAGPMTFYAALVSLLVVLCWGVQYALLTGRMVVTRFGHFNWNSKGRRQGSSDEQSTADSAQPAAGGRQNADEHGHAAAIESGVWLALRAEPPSVTAAGQETQAGRQALPEAEPTSDRGL